MNIGYLYIALIVVGVIVGVALIWFLIELIMTIRKTRKKVDEIHQQVTPTIENIEVITEKLQPAVEKIDPLIERVTLTVDAANLELMRADQILDNVNVITEGVAGATTAVGNIANAPVDLVNKATDKISGLFSGGKAKKFLENNIAGELGEGVVADAIANNDDVQKLASASKKQRRVMARRAKATAKANAKDAKTSAKKAKRGGKAGAKASAADVQSAAQTQPIDNVNPGIEFEINNEDDGAKPEKKVKPKHGHHSVKAAKAPKKVKKSNHKQKSSTTENGDILDDFEFDFN